MKHNIIEESPFSTFLFSNSRSSWLWLILRCYVGWEWLSAGWVKIHSSLWVGSQSGGALSGFVQGALNKTGGAHPDVQGWYAYFLQHAVLPHASVWAHVVAYGEVFVGVALIIGVFTGIAAFFGLFMNLSYLLAGTISINPMLFTVSIGLILAWKVAGYIGLDYFLLPWFGTPWKAKVVPDGSV
jgi:thiosulfate dehydrogenase [quinone] large subunit